MTCINKAKLSSELSVVETDFVRREGQARFHLFFRDLYNITVPQEKKILVPVVVPSFVI